MKTFNLKFLKKKIFLLSIFLIISCQPGKQINFTSSEAFFKSLDTTKTIDKKNFIENKIPTKNNKKSYEKEKISISKKKDREAVSKLKNKNDNDLRRFSSNKIEKLKNNSKITDKDNTKTFNLKLYIGKTKNELMNMFRQPNLNIKHGIITNFQYHLKNCFVDLFFINNNDKHTLKYFEFRPTKIKGFLDEELCKKDLQKSLKLN